MISSTTDLRDDWGRRTLISIVVFAPSCNLWRPLVQSKREKTSERYDDKAVQGFQKNVRKETPSSVDEEYDTLINAQENKRNEINNKAIQQ